MSADLLTRAFIDPPQPDRFAVLCGSGISISPPTLAFTVNHFIDALSARLKAKTGAPDALVDSILWGSDRFPRLRFELVCFCLKEIDRRYSFLAPLRLRETPSGFVPLPNPYHRSLAELIVRGATVITVNFDCFIEHALLLNGNIDRAATQLLKPHGTAQRWDGRRFIDEPPEGVTTTIFDVARGGEIDGFPEHLQATMRAIKDRDLAVLGYSASDSFDLQPALMGALPARCTWYLYGDDDLHHIDIDSTEIPESVRVLLENWQRQGISVACVRGDLGRQLGVAGGAVRPSLTNLFRHYRPDQCWYLLGRLGLNQGDYAAARHCFDISRQSKFKAVREWSLRYLARAQDTWSEMLAHALDARLALRSPEARVSNEYMVLDALCVLERKADFLHQFQMFRLMRRQTRLRGLYATELHRARALHCAGLYFRYSRRPGLARIAFRASLAGRTLHGEPIDIFKANNGIFLATLDLEGPLGAGHLLGPLSAYATEVNDDNVWLEYWQSAAEFSLSEGRFTDAIECFNRAKRMLPARGDADAVLSGYGLTATLIRAGRLRWAARAKRYFLERCAVLGMTETAKHLHGLGV